MEDVVARITAYMEEKGFTSSSFADALGMNRPTVLHILNGRNKPNLNLLISLAHLDPELDLRFVLTGTRQESPPTPAAPVAFASELPFEQAAPTPELEKKKEIEPVKNETVIKETVVKEYIYVLKPDGTYARYRKEAL